MGDPWNPYSMKDPWNPYNMGDPCQYYGTCNDAYMGDSSLNYSDVELPSTVDADSPFHTEGNTSPLTSSPKSAVPDYMAGVSGPAQSTDMAWLRAQIDYPWNREMLRARARGLTERLRKVTKRVGRVCGSPTATELLDPSLLFCVQMKMWTAIGLTEDLTTEIVETKTQDGNLSNFPIFSDKLQWIKSVMDQMEWLLWSRPFPEDVTEEWVADIEESLKDIDILVGKIIDILVGKISALG